MKRWNRLLLNSLYLNGHFSGTKKLPDHVTFVKSSTSEQLQPRCVSLRCWGCCLSQVALFVEVLYVSLYSIFKCCYNVKCCQNCVWYNNDECVHFWSICVTKYSPVIPTCRAIQRQTLISIFALPHDEVVQHWEWYHGRDQSLFHSCQAASQTGPHLTCKFLKRFRAVAFPIVRSGKWKLHQI